MRDSVIFIVNPISGSRRKKKRILKALQQAGCRIRLTKYAGEAEEIARDAKESTVVAVGGDGTVNEVARGLAGSGKKMGIIPCGSGNGLARHLGLNLSTRKLLRIIDAGRWENLDYGTINGKAFFSVCGTGLDAIVSERFAAAGTRGLRTYIREALAAWKSFKPEEYELTVDGKKRRVEAVLITVGNSCQWGNGAKITPKAHTGDGWLDITILKKFHTLEIPGLVFRLMTGTLDGSRRTECLRGKSISVLRQSPGPIHFDGDFTQAGTELKIDIISSGLKVIVP